MHVLNLDRLGIPTVDQSFLPVQKSVSLAVKAHFEFPGYRHRENLFCTPEIALQVADDKHRVLQLHEVYWNNQSIIWLFIPPEKKFKVLLSERFSWSHYGRKIKLYDRTCHLTHYTFTSRTDQHAPFLKQTTCDNGRNLISGSTTTTR
jgi:hypothetical protein